MNNEMVITAQMLIRKPANQVYNAFVHPEITTNFWFTKASGALAVGETITWTWEMYQVSAQVHVLEMVHNKLIKLQWGVPQTTIEFLFTPLSEETTYVEIKNYGFELEGKELINAVIDNTGGFTTVLDGLKAYLEHGINLNLIADKFPKKG